MKMAQSIAGLRTRQAIVPSALYEMIPSIGEHETSIVLHNDGLPVPVPACYTYKLWKDLPFQNRFSNGGLLSESGGRAEVGRRFDEFHC
jgi:hypothetical protein